MMKTAILTTRFILGLGSLCNQASAATREYSPSHSATFPHRHRALQIRDLARGSNSGLFRDCLYIRRREVVIGHC
jgi:hypothetical protein